MTESEYSILLEKIEMFRISLQDHPYTLSKSAQSTLALLAVDNIQPTPTGLLRFMASDSGVISKTEAIEMLKWEAKIKAKTK